MAGVWVALICLSSFRPFDKCTHEIAENQKKAFRSWLTAFDRIILFGEPCSVLSSCLSQFVSCVGKPSIKAMASVAAGFEGWSCIVNADIVIDGPKLREVQWKLHNRRCVCALSRRWDAQDQMIIDSGLDWFAARGEVWAHVARVIPESFCLGRILYDTWLCSFFSVEYRAKCGDCSRERFVWHPRHGERTDQNFDAPTNDTYLKQPSWPTVSTL